MKRSPRSTPKKKNRGPPPRPAAPVPDHYEPIGYGEGNYRTPPARTY